MTPFERKHHLMKLLGVPPYKKPTKAERDRLMKIAGPWESDWEPNVKPAFSAPPQAEMDE